MNGKVVTAKKPPPGKTKIRTYFGQIAVLAFHPGNSSQYFKVVIDPSSVIINGQHYSWKDSKEITANGFEMTIHKKEKVVAKMANNIIFSVLRHIVKKKADHKIDYLGFYIKDGRGLSKTTHGLIGEYSIVMVKENVVKRFLANDYIIDYNL